MVIMNKARRKELAEIILTLHDEKENIDKLKSRLEFIIDEEESVMDKMPESLQESNRFYTMEENVNKMGDALDELDTIVTEIGEVIYDLREIE